MEPQRNVKRGTPLFLKFLAIAIFTPTLLNMGINWEDINSWGDAVNVIVTMAMNPYLLGSAVFGAWIFLKGDGSEEGGKKDEE